MRHKLFYIAALLTLLSCSSHPGEVNIRGRFAHLEQGEFFIYSSDGGMDRMDTLRIRDGEFRYTLPLEGDATLHILYPNFSQLTIFAHGGDDIKVDGDAQNLSEVEVKGTKDNELYTEFRKEILQQSSKEARQTARQYALEHPTLALSRYLLREYFLLADSVSHAEVTEIYDSLCRACPDDVTLVRLSSSVRSHGVIAIGQRLPDFKLQTRKSFFPDGQGDRVITNKDFSGGYLLISFWAGWKTGSQSALYRNRRTIRDMKAKGVKFNVISYSLEGSENLLRRVEERDSVSYYSYCDFKLFDSPLARDWDVSQLPFFVLAGPDMKVVAFGSDWQKDIEPKISKLCL